MTSLVLNNWALFNNINKMSHVITTRFAAFQMQYLGQYSISTESCGNFAVADTYNSLRHLVKRLLKTMLTQELLHSACRNQQRNGAEVEK